LVRIEVRSAVHLEGSIIANGANTMANGGGGGGSGGAIFIQCQTFSGGTNGLLSANGGNGLGGICGGGGGGRIAVWPGMPDQWRDRILAGQMPGGVTITDDWENFQGTLSVTNGTGWRNPPDPDGAYPGTIVFLVPPPVGTVISIR
jgi:hypothetical protein